jgi:NAD-dependent deacetylase
MRLFSRRPAPLTPALPTRALPPIECPGAAGAAQETSVARIRRGALAQRPEYRVGVTLAPQLLAEALRGAGPLVFLTGAGISAESGIPTFRGPEGYWRVGSRNYQPTELATAAAFGRMPEEIWRWYLYRRGVCRAARPNPAHAALVEAEGAFGARFLLVTQNVDGLHLRAGNSLARTYQIHGNIDFVRCADDCAPGEPPRPMPAGLGERWEKERTLGEEERRLLRCHCGGWLRPHVLWFDECYDEPLYRFESALAATERAAALIIVGTSGATTLPARMCERAAERGIPLLVLDPEPTVFAEIAEASPAGAFLRGPAGALVPALVAQLRASAGGLRL